MLCVTPIVALPVRVVPPVGVIAEKAAAELTSAPAPPMPVPWRLRFANVSFRPLVSNEPVVTVTLPRS